MRVILYRLCCRSFARSCCECRRNDIENHSNNGTGRRRLVEWKVQTKKPETASIWFDGQCSLARARIYFECMRVFSPFCLYADTNTIAMHMARLQNELTHWCTARVEAQNARRNRLNAKEIVRIESVGRGDRFLLFQLQTNRSQMPTSRSEADWKSPLFVLSIRLIPFNSLLNSIQQDRRKFLFKEATTTPALQVFEEDTRMSADSLFATPSR